MTLASLIDSLFLPPYSIGEQVLSLGGTADGNGYTIHVVAVQVLYLSVKAVTLTFLIRQKVAIDFCVGTDVVDTPGRVGSSSVSGAIVEAVGSCVILPFARAVAPSGEVLRGHSDPAALEALHIAVNVSGVSHASTLDPVVGRLSIASRTDRKNLSARFPWVGFARTIVAQCR